MFDQWCSLPSMLEYDIAIINSSIPIEPGRMKLSSNVNLQSHEKPSYKSNSLHIAAGYGHKEIVEDILNSGK